MYNPQGHQQRDLAAVVLSQYAVLAQSWEKIAILLTPANRLDI